MSITGFEYILFYSIGLISFAGNYIFMGPVISCFLVFFVCPNNSSEISVVDWGCYTCC